MQNLFDLHYFIGMKELVPTGWQAVDEDRTYSTLSSRNLQPHSDGDEESANDFEMTNGPAGSESSDEDDDDSSPGLGNSTRTVEESSEEDELTHPIAPRVCQHIPFALGHSGPATPMSV